MIIILYIILCLVTYFVCVIFNAFKWIIKLKIFITKQKSKLTRSKEKFKKLKSNNDGLTAQRQIDLKDKTYLESIISQQQTEISKLQNMLNIANTYIDPKRIFEYTMHMKATKEINEDEKTTNCKNNKFKKISD